MKNKKDSFFLSLAFCVLALFACASENYASRKEKPDWPTKPPPATEDKIYFVGASVAKNIENGKKQATANAVAELFAFAFGVSGKAEYVEFVSLKEQDKKVKKMEVITDSIALKTAQGSLINVSLADWYWQKNKDGEYEVWVLIEVEKNAIWRAQEEKKAKELGIEKMLKRAKDEDIKTAINILTNIDPEALEDKFKFEYQDALMKTAQKIDIELEKEEEKEIVFKVFSKEDRRKTPLSGVPVTCQTKNENTSKSWSDDLGRVQCPKSLFATKISAQVFAPFGAKASLESSLRFALLKFEDDSPEYKFAFEEFKKTLQTKGVLFTEVKISKTPSSDNQIFGVIFGAKDKIEKIQPKTRLVIVFELTAKEIMQSYDPGHPANYYYVTRYIVTSKCEGQVSLFDIEPNEVFTMAASKTITAEAGLETLNKDTMSTVAKVAASLGEELGMQFIYALSELK